jgi:hypothetical protein
VYLCSADLEEALGSRVVGSGRGREGGEAERVEALPARPVVDPQMGCRGGVGGECRRWWTVSVGAARVPLESGWWGLLGRASSRLLEQREGVEFQSVSASTDGWWWSRQQVCYQSRGWWGL